MSLPVPPTDDPFAPVHADDDATIFSVLAARARGHSVGHLWAATLVGAADAAAIAIALPSLWWLALLSAALSAFGAWGLADAALEEPRSGLATTRAGAIALHVVRVTAVTLGSVAILGLIFGLFGAALEGWRH